MSVYHIWRTTTPGAGRLEKICEESRSIRSTDAFRMKLNAENGELSVGKSHQTTVVRPRERLELRRQAVLTHGPRMVSHRREW